MPYAKISLRAEQRTLRDRMRALELSHQQIAVEFSRRYGLRPRAAWRHAHGWSLKDAAEQINRRAAATGLDPSGRAAMTGPHLCEYENWPGQGPKPAGRRPTPLVLALLAKAYSTPGVHDLLDIADYEHMPAADRLVLGTVLRPEAPSRSAIALTAAGRYRAGAAESGELPSSGLPAAPAMTGLAQRTPAGRVNARVAAGLAPLASALLSAPTESRNPPDHLAREVRHMWKLRQAAQYQKLAADLPRALIRARRYESAPAAGKPATALAAVTHLYNVASSVAKSLGSFELAGIAADRAVLAADRTGDRLLAGAAAYRLANVLLSAGQLGSARVVAVAAADRLRPVMTATASHTSLWGALLATAAQAAASDQAAAEAWELLGASKVAAGLLPAEHADLYSIFGPASWLIHAVSIAADLGDGTQAVRRAAQVPPDRLPPLLSERRAFLLLSTARGHALRNDARSAADALLAAWHWAPEEICHNPLAHQLVSHLLSASAGRSGPLQELAATMSAGSGGSGPGRTPW